MVGENGTNPEAEVPQDFKLALAQKVSSCVVNNLMIYP